MRCGALWHVLRALGYLANQCAPDLSVPALMAALGVFALFGALSVLFWAYFRFRPARPKASAEG